MNLPEPSPATKAVETALGILTLICVVLFLIVLTSCACDPHVEYCGEPFPAAEPRR